MNDEENPSGEVQIRARHDGDKLYLLVELPAPAEVAEALKDVPGMSHRRLNGGEEITLGQTDSLRLLVSLGDTMRPIAALAQMLDGINAACDDPNCPVHGDH